MKLTVTEIAIHKEGESPIFGELVTISLDNTEYNNIKFSIKPRANFAVMNRENEISKSQGATQSNKMLTKSSVEDVKQFKKEKNDKIQNAMDTSSS